MTSRGWRQLLNDIFRGRSPERNATAMERKWDPRLDDLGVRLEAPAQAEYRLVEASWVDPSEANDKRHIYVRVLDKDGTPLEGHPFRITNGGVRIERTKGPGFDQYWGNYPMFGGGVYTVDIPDVTSDKLTHMVTGSKGRSLQEYVLRHRLPAQCRDCATSHARANPGPHQDQRLAPHRVRPRAQGRRRILAPAPSWTRPHAPGCWGCWIRPRPSSMRLGSCWRDSHGPQADARRLPLARHLAAR